VCYLVRLLCRVDPKRTSCWDSTILSQYSNNQSYKDVQTKVTAPDYKSLETLLVPIHVNEDYWVLIALRFERKIPHCSIYARVMDPMRGSSHSFDFRQHCEFIEAILGQVFKKKKEKLNPLVVVEQKVLRQQDAASCGSALW
jgi:hypothetical protein